MFGLLAAALVASPMLPALFAPRRTYILHFYDGTYTRNEHYWFAQGRALERVLQPEARMAVRGAGAVVYASHHSAIDLHGKCDREIAHLPVLEAGRTPGHQKAYIDFAFRTRSFDVSLPEPPDFAAANFVRCELAGQPVWFERTSPFVNWSALEDACPR